MDSPKKKTRAIFIAAIVTLLANYAISSTTTTDPSYYKASDALYQARSGSGTNTTTPRPARSGSGTNTTTPRPSVN